MGSWVNDSRDSNIDGVYAFLQVYTPENQNRFVSSTYPGLQSPQVTHWPSDPGRFSKLLFLGYASSRGMHQVHIHSDFSWGMHQVGVCIRSGYASSPYTSDFSWGMHQVHIPQTFPGVCIKSGYASSPYTSDFSRGMCCATFLGYVLRDFPGVCILRHLRNWWYITNFWKYSYV